jgi:hypothetical protein
MEQVTSGYLEVNGQEQQTQWMNREGTAGGISKRKQENVRQVRW